MSGASVAAAVPPVHSWSMEEIRHILARLRRLLHHRGRSVDDTDDLIQEACLRLHVYCRQHKVEQTEAFLVRTVLNLATDERRKAHARPLVSNALEELPLIDTSPQPHEVYAGRQRLQHLRAGLEALSPRAREVFVLHRLDGLSHPQIAQRLGITLSMVEKHAARATLFLTNWMQQVQE